MPTFTSGIFLDDVIALLSINTTVSDDSVAVELMRENINFVNGQTYMYI